MRSCALWRDRTLLGRRHGAALAIAARHSRSVPWHGRRNSISGSRHADKLFLRRSPAVLWRISVEAPRGFLVPVEAPWGFAVEAPRGFVGESILRAPLLMARGLAYATATAQSSRNQMTRCDERFVTTTAARSAVQSARRGPACKRCRNGCLVRASFTNSLPRALLLPAAHRGAHATLRHETSSPRNLISTPAGCISFSR